MSNENLELLPNQPVNQRDLFHLCQPMRNHVKSAARGLSNKKVQQDFSSDRRGRPPKTKRRRWMRLIAICGDNFVRNPHIDSLRIGRIFSAVVDSENGIISDSADGKFHTPQQWYNHHTARITRYWNEKKTSTISVPIQRCSKRSNTSVIDVRNNIF